MLNRLLIFLRSLDLALTGFSITGICNIATKKPLIRESFCINLDNLVNYGEGMRDREKLIIKEESRKIAKYNEDSHSRQISMEKLPFFDLQSSPMELFEPSDSTLFLLQKSNEQNALRNAARNNTKRVFIPREQDCVALWDAYGMLDNIREHCIKVACFARDMAKMTGKNEGECNEHAAYAAGLLHDLGKTYTIKNGGSHAQLGASWVMNEIRNGPIARAVLFHVHWPWEEMVEECIANDRFFLSLAVAYADKRVRHSEYVTLDERFADLMERYAVTELAKERIKLSWNQGKIIEKAFSQRFKVNLETYTPHCRGMVS